MKFWENLSVVQRRLTMVSTMLVGVVAIFGTLFAGYGHFSTDMERETAIAEVRKEQRDFEQTIAVTGNRAEINRSKREINRINAKLLDPNLPATEQTLLRQQKDEYEDLIDCIRTGKKLCY